MKPEQVRRATWIDFEGTTTERPPMLGVLWTPDSTEAPELTQYVFDESLRVAVEASNELFDYRIVMADPNATLTDLVARSDATGRHLASWSLYDYNMIVEELDRVAVRFLNAKQTAKRWRRSRHPELADQPHDPQTYLRLIGYDVPPGAADGAASNIRYVRDRTESKDSWVQVSPGGKEAWRRLVTHNYHDLHGMRRVLETATGIG